MTKCIESLITKIPSAIKILRVTLLIGSPSPLKDKHSKCIFFIPSGEGDDEGDHSFSLFSFRYHLSQIKLSHVFKHTSKLRHIKKSQETQLEFRRNHARAAILVMRQGGTISQHMLNLRACPDPNRAVQSVN